MADVPRPDFAELPLKLARLRDALPDAHTLVLRRQGSLAWLLGGRSHVPQTLDAACFDTIVDLGSGGLAIVANAIEAPRLRDTELAGLDADWRVLPWWEGRPAAWPTGEGVVTDLPYPGAADVTEPVARVRRRLTARQAADLATLCADAARAATDVVAALRPDQTEYEAAGAMARRLLADGMDPIVLMVAGARRMPLHRHPLPTTEPLGDRAMLVFCARRHGLVASVTRIVSFRALSPADRDRYRAILAVEASFLTATRPGRTLAEVVREGTAAYARHGFAPDEWHRHHQGGFSGWEPREFPATPASEHPIEADAVIAWNPSGDGWKVEDTCLVTEDGVRPLVTDAAWPVELVDGRPRPGVWEA